MRRPSGGTGRSPGSGCSSSFPRRPASLGPAAPRPAIRRKENETNHVKLPISSIQNSSFRIQNCPALTLLLLAILAWLFPQPATADDGLVALAANARGAALNLAVKKAGLQNENASM